MSLLYLKILDVLVYYDVPQVFTAKDLFQSKYICMIIEESPEIKYLGIKISNERYIKLLQGELDLRIIFEKPEVKEWYDVICEEENLHNFSATRHGWDMIPESYLPDEGFFIEEESWVVEGSQLIKESIESESTVIHLAFSDSTNSNSLNAALLGEYMILFQKLIEYLYKLAVGNDKSKDVDKNYVLRIFDTSKGSFKVHMKGDGEKDKNLFGNNELERSLVKLDEITEDIQSNEEIIKLFTQYRGRSIGAYKKLIEKMLEESIRIKYEWYSLTERKIYSREIKRSYAERVKAILDEKEELSRIEVEFKGVFKQVDVDKGTWRLSDTESNKEFNGFADSSILKGAEIDSTKYIFKCEEITEQKIISTKSSTKYKLIEYVNLL
ncbi:DUF6575 domain-containing protein [Saprospira sp. CCB-QB6]|uniref:DUF6575 domain-containing protein n=1 Tax=Saprospira sp. CCB-QB6 TaxID=3023936 RepID=UPI00300DD7FA